MAKKFKFKLQTLLDLRIRTEDEKKRNFAEALQRVEAKKAEISDLKEEAQRTRTEMAEVRTQGRVNMKIVIDFERYIHSLEMSIGLKTAELARLEEELERCRQNLVEAMKQRKVLDKLKDRKREEWRKEIDRQEAYLLNEVGIQQHIHRNEDETGMTSPPEPEA